MSEETNTTETLTNEQISSNLQDAGVLVETTVEDTVSPALSASVKTTDLTPLSTVDVLKSGTTFDQARAELTVPWVEPK